MNVGGAFDQKKVDRAYLCDNPVDGLPPRVVVVYI
jgi:hypothetical protein